MSFALLGIGDFVEICGILKLNDYLYRLIFDNMRFIQFCAEGTTAKK